MKRLFASGLALVLLTGCNVLNMKTGDGAQVKGWVVAWPWQDSSSALQRVMISHKTNNSAINMSGLSQEQVTSTNAVALIQAVVGAAVEGAVKAAK